MTELSCTCTTTPTPAPPPEPMTTAPVVAPVEGGPASGVASAGLEPAKEALTTTAEAAGALFHYASSPLFYIPILILLLVVLGRGMFRRA